VTLTRPLIHTDESQFEVNEDWNCFWDLSLSKEHQYPSGIIQYSAFFVEGWRLMADNADSYKSELRKILFSSRQVRSHKRWEVDTPQGRDTLLIWPSFFSNWNIIGGRAFGFMSQRLGLLGYYDNNTSAAAYVYSEKIKLLSRNGAEGISQEIANQLLTSEIFQQETGITDHPLRDHIINELRYFIE
jgi:hypothetical protein